MVQRLETKAKCIDSTYSMTFLTVRITKHWSNTLQKSKYRISHVKREKISLNPSVVLRTVAFISTRICTVLSKQKINICETWRNSMKKL